MMTTLQQQDITSDDDDIACSQAAREYDASHCRLNNPFVEHECAESDDTHYGYTSVSDDGESETACISLASEDTSPPSSPPTRKRICYKILEDSEVENESDLSHVPSEFSLTSGQVETAIVPRLSVLELLRRRNTQYQEDLLQQIAAIDAACTSNDPILIE